MRNCLCHSLCNCTIMCEKGFFRAKHNQLRHTHERDSGRSLMLSTKFGCVNQSNSKCLLLIEHDMEISSRAHDQEHFYF